jgi:hypothetical protein
MILLVFLRRRSSRSSQRRLVTEKDNSSAYAQNLSLDEKLDTRTPESDPRRRRSIAMYKRHSDTKHG